MNKQRSKTDREYVKKESRDLPANLVMGRNAVAEVLKSGRPVEKLLIQKNSRGSVEKIFSLAKDRGIPYTLVERSALDRLADGTAHQGVVAYAAPYEYASVEAILQMAEERGEDPFLVLLDGVEDPHNLGAILRSCECAGAHGVIIPKHAGVGLTETVAKSSAGAVEYVPVARVSNLVNTMKGLKEKGLWIAACDMGENFYYEADLTGPMALVIGGEGKGVGRLVKETCDLIVSIPMKGRIQSLNASNAAAIVLYEVRRQRDVKR